jgi:hypothetical protein
MNSCSGVAQDLFHLSRAGHVERCHPAPIRRVGISSVRDEKPGDLELPAVDGPAQRRLLPGVARVNSCAMVEQCLRYRNVTLLLEGSPELSDLLRTVVYACDYCVSPVKLDQQSTIGVPSAIQAINEVNDDMEMIGQALGGTEGYTPTVFKGAMGMMCREWDAKLPPLI